MQPIFADYITIPDKRYLAATLSTRYYLRENRTEFFTALAGYGNSPDDISRDFSLIRLNAYNTVSVGAGYQRQVYYRTTLMINATWYNLQAATNDYQNQFDIYVGLIRNF